MPEIIYPSSKITILENLQRSFLLAASVNILIILFGYGQSAKGGTFPDSGPGLAVESYNPGQSKNESNSENGPGPTIATRRYQAWIIAPIPAAVFSGLLTFQGAIISENQIAREPAIGPMSSNLQYINTRRVTNVGLKWHPHHKEGAPKYFLQLERTGLPDMTKTIKPIASFTVGSEIGEDDLPIPLNFQPTDISKTRVFLTAHRFSRYYRFDVGVGHKLKIKSGYFLDLLIPEHAFIGFQTAGEDFIVAAGSSKQREFFPWFSSGLSGWGEEWNEKRSLSFKWKLYEPIHLAIDCGFQRKREKYFNDEKNQVAESTTTFAPFIRFAFETWLSVL